MQRGFAMGILLGLAISGCSDTSKPAVADGKPASHWLELMYDSNPMNRVEAVKKLNNIGGKEPEAIDAIIVALDDEDAQVRRTAIEAVVRNREHCRKALPKLEEMSREDTSEEVKSLAGESFRNLSQR